MCCGMQIEDIKVLLDECKVFKEFICLEASSYHGNRALIRWVLDPILYF